MLLMLRLARCCQYETAGPLSHKLWYLLLIVSDGVDSRKWWRNVYDKKFQRYAKGNRTAHLITCSDKSVAYITNSKRLLDVLYRSSQLLTDMKHCPTTSSQQHCYVSALPMLGWFGYVSMHVTYMIIVRSDVNAEMLFVYEFMSKLSIISLPNAAVGM